MPLPDTYFHLGGGGFGGPVVKNRTFFWACDREATARTRTRNGALRVPTALEKRGDFSQTLDSAGNVQVVIYDPLTGDQATGGGPHAIRRQRHSAEPPQPGRA